MQYHFCAKSFIQNDCYSFLDLYSDLDSSGKVNNKNKAKIKDANRTSEVTAHSSLSTSGGNPEKSTIDKTFTKTDKVFSLKLKIYSRLYKSN